MLFLTVMSLSLGWLGILRSGINVNLLLQLIDGIFV